MKKGQYRAILWIAVLGLMTVIFAFSAQVGTSSEAMTSTAVMPFAELLASMQTGDNAVTAEVFFIIIGTIVRKLAHVCEYALLGFLVHQLLMAYDLRMRWLPILLCIVYAVTDEIHQAFVPGRSGRPLDVLIDSAGVILGVYVVYIVTWIRERIRKSHE